MALRKVSTAYIAESGFWIFKHYRIHASKTLYWTLSRSRYAAKRDVVATRGAVLIGQDKSRTFWWAQDGFYWDADGLSAEAVEVLLWDRRRRLDNKVERITKVREKGQAIVVSRREAIPDDVKAFVWTRDEGRCVRCGAEDDLQYDHVISVARGGGTGPGNIQILCGNCNREKSDHVI